MKGIASSIFTAKFGAISNQTQVLKSPRRRGKRMSPSNGSSFFVAVQGVGSLFQCIRCSIHWLSWRNYLDSSLLLCRGDILPYASQCLSVRKMWSVYVGFFFSTTSLTCEWNSSGSNSETAHSQGSFMFFLLRCSGRKRTAVVRLGQLRKFLYWWGVLDTSYSGWSRCCRLHGCRTRYYTTDTIPTTLML